MSWLPDDAFDIYKTAHKGVKQALDETPHTPVNRRKNRAKNKQARKSRKRNR